MKQIIGVVGSSSIVGTDPWDPRCWSGSGSSLFNEIKNQGLLQDAIGVESPFIEKALYKLKNFRKNKRDWHRKFCLDPMYYRSLTRQVKSKLLPLLNANSVVLQLGAIYDVPSIVHPNIPCISYHDGNVAKLMTSPFFNKTLTGSAQNAFKWEKGVYKNLTYILTMSEYLRQSMIHDFGVDEQKVHNVGVGVNFNIPDISLLNSVTKSPADIVFVGREFERKGGKAILSAFDIVRRNHSNATLHVIGPKENPAPLVPGVKHYGFLHGNIKSESELFSQILSKSSIGVFPTLFDAFGIPVLEMMSYKIPCIATNILAMPEMVIPNKTGFLVDINNGEQVAKYILHYIQHPEIRQQHGEQARKLVVSRYTWTNVVDQIKNIVQSLQ